MFIQFGTCKAEEQLAETWTHCAAHQNIFSGNNYNSDH